MIPIRLPKEHKDEIAARLKQFFAEERSEAIGDLGAERIIDFMVKEMGPYIYNKAISDVRSLMNQNAAQIEDELYAMEKPTR